MFSRRPMLALVAAVACALTLSLASHAEVTAGSKSARVLITQKIDETKLVTREGNVSPQARIAKNDRGEAADSMPMPGIELLMKRSPEQEAAFTKLMDELHSPGSPYYHKWLTQNQINESFGLNSKDVETAKVWLEGHGFKIVGIDPAGMWIEFDGTAGEVREAFHTEIHNFQVNGETRFGNVSEPKIPAALANAVVGPVQLHNFRLPVLATPISKVRMTSTGAAVSNAKPQPGEPAPDYTASTTSYPFVPGDARIIYNVAPLTTAGYTGKGTSIALVEDSNDYADSDYATFVSTFFPSGLDGASSSNLSTVHPSGSATCSNPGDTGNGTDFEVESDIEYATAIAPAAQVIIESCADASTYGLVYALENLGASATPPPVLSMSYGIGETGSGATLNATYNMAFEQLAAKGVSSFVSSGDQGPTTDDRGTVGEHGNIPSGWSDSPYVTSVGGTDYIDGSKGTYTTYWNATNNSDYSSAKGYIPEIPWNDTCASSIVLGVVGSSTAYGSSGFCNSSEASSDGLQTDTGGSGGASNCYSGAATNGVAGSGSCAGLAKPSYQTVFGNPADGVRDQPDVSLFASNGFWGHYLVICYTNTAIVSGASCSGAPSAWPGVGGTSLSSPMMAGIQAVVNQYVGGTTNGVGQVQGAANYVYYKLANTEYGSAGSSTCNSNNIGLTGSTCVFNDVTSGDIEVACEALSGTLHGCYAPSGTYGASSTSTSAYAPAYSTTAGWDFATGIGTVNAANLASAWASAAFTPVPTIAGTVASYTYGATQTADTLTGAVSGPGSFPTGSVLFSYGLSANPVSGYTSIGTDALAASSGCASGGTCTESVTQSFTPGATLTPGTYNVDVTYSTVNEDYSAGIVSATPVTFTVSKATPTAAMSSNTSGYENNAVLSATDTGVTGGAAPTGTVTFTVNGVTVTGTPTCSGAGVVETCTETYTLPSNLTDGSYSMTASFAADANYNASNTASGTLTVHMDNTSTTVTASPTSVTYDTGTTMLTATVACTGAGPSVVGGIHGKSLPSCTAVPTGTVTFTDTTNSASLGSCTLAAGTCSATVNASAMAIGSNTITASYAAVALKFNASSGTTTVTVTKATPTVAVSSVTAGYQAAVTLSATDTGVTGGAAPSGTVSFTVNSSVVSGAPICSSAGVVETCSLSYTLPSNLTDGTYTLVATFAADTNYNTASGMGTLTVHMDNTSTTVVASPTSVTYKTGTTMLTAMVSCTGAGPSVVGRVHGNIPATCPAPTTGTVTFMDTTNSTTLGGCTLSAGTCSATANVSSMAIGSNTITANYAAVTGQFNASSGTTIVTVNKATPTAAISSATVGYGNTINLGATDTGVSGGAPPTGTVTFTVNGVTVTGAPICSGSGVVESCSESYTPPSTLTDGAYTITATFATDTNYNASNTATGTLTVHMDNTSTTVTANPTSIASNGTTQLTATVACTGTGSSVVGGVHGKITAICTAVPTGTVTFTDTTNSTTLGSCTLSAGTCTATANGSAMAHGSNTVTASYAGVTGEFNASSGTTTVTVGADTTSTSVSANPTTITTTASTQLTATVTDITNSGTKPTGTVTFTDTTNSASLGSCTLSSGTCSITGQGSAMALGSNTIMATYAGVSGTYGASSGTTTVTVNTANVGSITFSAVTHNFGSEQIGTAATAFGITVKNTSTTTAYPFTLVFTAANGFTTANNCGTSIAAGASCELVFYFTPTATGTVTATWSLSNQSTFTYSPSNGGTLTGTGVTSGAVTLTTDGHNFGTVAVGTQSPTYGTELSNSTSSTETITLGTVSAPFHMLTNCGTTLAAGASCEIEFYYMPTTTSPVSVVVPLSGTPTAITSGGVALPGGGITLSGN